MKQLLPFRWKFITLSIFFLSILNSNPIFSQCNSVTLTTQADVDSYFLSLSCPTISGSLTFSDAGTDPITDLSPVAFAGITTITGKLRIFDNLSLTSLDGLESITDVGTDVVIYNNFALSDLSALDNLTNVGGNFTINNTVAQDLTFASLQSVGSLMTIAGNHSLDDISGFNLLSSTSGLEVWDSDIIQDISGFQSLTTISGDLLFNNLLTLPGISGFGSLSQVDGNLFINVAPMSSGFPFFGPALTIGGNLQINFCNAITDINNFSTITSVGGDLNVISNGELSDCCIIFDFPVSGAYNISDNAPGCDSLAEIDGEVPEVICPADITVGLMAFPSGPCEASASILHPTPTDDCGVTLTGLIITDPSGNIDIRTFNPGTSVNYIFYETGDWFFEFSASDDLEQTGTCIMTVTVEDNSPPNWSDPSGSISLSATCGVDNAATLASMNIPTAIDDCGTATVTQISTTSAIICGASEVTTFTFQATDDSGNVNPTNFTIEVTLSDTSAPSLTGGTADVTIDCGDAFPSAPVLTASDVCAGDLTSAIVEDINITTGNCSFGTFAEIHDYTWTVTDGCGNSATETWSVTINNDFSANLGPDIDLCEPNSAILGPIPGGVSYVWSTGEMSSTIEVSTTGLYSVTVTSVNGCCAIDEIFVDISPLPSISAEGGVLDCNNDEIELIGESLETNVSFSWSGPNSFVSNDQFPIVNEPGLYTLTVTGSTGCQSSVSVEVTEDIEEPVVNLTGGTLNCIVTSIQLTSTSSMSNVSYDWSGPGGFSSTDANPTVSLDGTYTLTVTPSNGCFTIEDVEVESDLQAPTASATAATLSCNQTSIQIIANASSDATSFSWTGPNGFTSSDEDPVVSDPGIYSLTVGAANGCTDIFTVEVEADLDVPDASAEGGLLDCLFNEIAIFGNSTTTGVSFQWDGPGGFTSVDQNPLVSLGGTYTLTVTAPNGCIATSEAVVESDMEAPSASANVGTLSCSQPTSQIITNPSSNATSFSWDGPNGFTSSDEDPIVTEAGTYTLELGADNGCTSTVVLEVIGDFEAPDASAQGGTIDCMSNAIMIFGSSTTAGVGYQWSGPGGFTSNDQNPMVNESGTYTLTVEGANGCTSTSIAEVESNMGAPSASVDAGSLSCAQPTTQITTNPSADASSFSWTGPNGFVSTDEDPTVSEAGTYTLTVGAANGCSSIVTVEVTGSFDLPDASAQGGMITCLSNNVSLTASSTTTGVTFQWSGPGGFTSSEQNPVVTAPGNYTLSVVGPNGCISTANAVVESNMVAPSASIAAGMLSCAQTSTQITSNPSVDASSYSWTGPNGFTSNDENPVVSEPGIYTLVVSGSNGCSNTYTVDVTGDFNAPTASATGGTLGCNSTGVSLAGSSTTGGVSYQWSGPGGFTSNEQNPIATDIGSYTLTVIAANGCSTSTIAEVTADEDVPQISAIGGSLDCNTSSVQLMGSSTDAGVTTSWTGPNNFSTTEENPVVTEPGIYTFSVLAPNGCVATLNAQVVDDTFQPEIELSLSGTDCDAGTRQIVTQSNVPDLTVSWTGPNGFTSDELSPLITMAGTYTLETFPASGCNSTHSITMDEDVSYTAEITTEDITTENLQGSAMITIEGGTGPFSIMWDNGETSLTAMDLQEGEHTVVVTDGLGCVSTFVFFIDNLTSIFETELKDEIKFYPNPAVDFFTIDYSASQRTILSIDIFSMEGKLVKQTGLDANQKVLTVSVDGWSTGIYFVKVNTSTSYYTTSILVE